MNAAPRALRIGIDGRVLMHYEMRGFARYTVELFRAMKQIADGEIELISFSPEPLAREFLELLDIRPVVFQAPREILWEQVELPRRLAKERIDVYHVTTNRGLPYRRVAKYVVTCHDIIDRLPQYGDGETWRSALRKRYADFISRHSADRFVTVSEFSRKDICRFHRLPLERVVVIYNAASERFYQRLPAERIAQVGRKYGLPRQYFLFLAGFDKRKNAAMLVEAFAQLPRDLPPLVLAGEHKWEFSRISERIAALGLGDRVTCPERIADEDLPAIYQGAMALVHPSRYEGFGLQLVEAMASGVPVLASHSTSLPEVLSGCGLLFDPEDAASIAGAMERIGRGPELRNTLADRGRQRARSFSWHKAAEQILNLYCQLLAASREFRAYHASETTEQHR